MNKLLDANGFRKVILEKVEELTGGKITDTGHHLEITGGQYDAAKVEFGVEKFGAGFAAYVAGKKVRNITTVSNENLWTVAGAVWDYLKAEKNQLERLRTERADTEECLLALKDFTFSDKKCRWNVSNGRAHLEIRASFSPSRLGAFRDLMEFADATLEEEDVSYQENGEVEEDDF